jgi:hypothetical protein
MDGICFEYLRGSQVRSYFEMHLNCGKIRIFANFGVILELITYSDVNIDIEAKRK